MLSCNLVAAVKTLIIKIIETILGAGRWCGECAGMMKGDGGRHDGAENLCKKVRRRLHSLCL